MQGSIEKLETMCVGLVGEIIDKVEDASNIFSEKTVWSFMREYERLKKREKHFKNKGVVSSLINKSTKYRKIIK